MKNVTLSVEEDVLARVRRFAAQRDTSVNALVREFLKAIAEKEARARQARQRIRLLSQRSPARLGPRSWTRDELHER